MHGADKPPDAGNGLYGRRAFLRGGIAAGAGGAVLLSAAVRGGELPRRLRRAVAEVAAVRRGVKLEVGRSGGIHRHVPTRQAALARDPADPIPPFETVVAHPTIAIYWQGWMQPGDAGVVAEVDGETLGMAYCRLFAADAGSQGFCDELTPEPAIGVAAARRGRGIGERLIRSLAAALLVDGVPRLSLSINPPNPAKRLYERLGFATVRSHEDNDVMVGDVSRLAVS